MWDLLRQLNEDGVGFLLTTHYLEEAQQLCKRVTFLNQGKVVTTGVPSEIVGQLGAFCVENGSGTNLFQTQEEALDYLRENGGKLRDTNLEDVFFRLSGGAV
jgi:ABC-2 type transport system ATP-binding protein